MGSILESEDLKIVAVFESLIQSIFQHALGEGTLVSRSHRAITQMHRGHARWSNGHHVLAENVGVVMGCYILCIEIALLESFICVAVSSVDHRVVVITEGNWAV